MEAKAVEAEALEVEAEALEVEAEADSEAIISFTASASLEQTSQQSIT